MRTRIPLIAAIACACLVLIACTPLGPKPPTPAAPSDTTTTTQANPTPTEDGTPDDLPVVSSDLIDDGDLVLVGSFTVPNAGESPETSLAYSGTGLAYNDANDSLFITGHDHHQHTAEVTIPQTLGTGSIDSLPRSTYLQQPADATNGGLPRIASPALEGFERIGGYLVVDGQLVVSGYHFYDAADTQTHSHFLADTTFAEASEPIALSPDIPPRWLGGPMAEIPEAWRPAFGSDAYLTGLGGISIASNSSVGPAAASFGPAALDGSASATLVLGYPLDTPLAPPEQQSNVWNLTSEVRGMVFPANSGSVLFFGSHGTGAYCYGTGDECGDPAQPYQGTHAPPYRYQVWAYAAEDMADVYAGQRSAESVTPYKVWELDLPYSSETHQITGTAYDPATGRIFVGQGRADGDLPIIHVLTVR